MRLVFHKITPDVLAKHLDMFQKLDSFIHQLLDEIATTAHGVSHSLFFGTSSPSLSSEDEDDDDEDDEPEEQEDDEDEELDPDREEDDDEDEDLDEELDEELEEDASESVSDPDLLLASLRLLLLSFFCFRLSGLGASGLVRAASIRLSFSPSFNPTPVGVGGLREGQVCVPASSSPAKSSSSLGVTSLGMELVSGEGGAPGFWLCAKGVGVRVCPSSSA